MNRQGSESPVDQHLRRLGRSLWVVPHRRRRLLREARDHLLAAVEREAERGASIEQAERLAVARFGASRRLVRAEVREAGVLWATFVAGLVAVGVTVVFIVERSHPVVAMLPDRFNYHTTSVSGTTSAAFPMVGYSDAVSPWAISAFSSRDAWIVGSPGTLAWRWNGARWSSTPMAFVPGSEFHSVVSIASNDAWAVGSFSDTAARSSWPLIEHWNGTSWHQAPQPRYQLSTFNAVAASDSRNVWAVGAAFVKHHRCSPCGSGVHGRNRQRDYQPLIERWNGAAWHVVHVPWAKPGIWLDSVQVAGSDDVWVVATRRNGSPTVLLQHWDGTAWTSVRPPFGAGQQIASFSASSATDAWAVGGYLHRGHSQTIAAHWDGHHWAIAPTPSHNTDSALSDVVAISPTDAWAMGARMYRYFVPSGVCPDCRSDRGGMIPVAFFLHWDGRRWAEAPSQVAMAAAGVPTGLDITTAADGTAFAVGVCTANTIIMHWSGEKWRESRHPGHPIWLLGTGHAFPGPEVDVHTARWRTPPTPPSCVTGPNP